MSENEKLKEKLDLLSALKEDEEKEKKKKQKKENKPVKKKKETSKKAEVVLEEIKKVKESTPPRRKNSFLIVISFIALVISLTYLIYNIVKASNQINQPYLIINSCILLVISSTLVLTGFNTNRKMQKRLNTLNVSLFALYTLFQFLVTSNIVTIPTLKTVGDFSNTSINEVIKWAGENHITLEQTYEYSDSVEASLVISQSLPANTLLREVKSLEVVVSNGPNYESLVSTPNMIGWHIDDVVKKIKDLKLSNVKIDYDFNDAIEKDIAYEQNKSGEMRRNEELILKFSLGKEADLKPVELIDLSDKEEFDAVLWLKRNGIKYEIRYEFDNDVEHGKVITTNPKKGTIINQKEETVKLVISKGPKIVAPNLLTMSLDEITEWAIKSKVILVYDSEYSDKVSKGKIIRVSVKEGDVLEENARIQIITSRGPLKMFAYTNGDITALRNFVAEHNLTLTETEEFSDSVEKGKFISISKKPGDPVNTGEEIKVVISLGASIEIPNFIGMSASKAQSTCKSLGLTCKLSYVYSSRAKGNIFNQSMTAGSKVIGGTNIVLTISNGPRPVNNNGSSTNQGSNSNSSTNQGSNSSNNTTPPPTPTCTSYQLRLGAGGNIDQTKSIIKQLNPNGKFNFVLINPGYGANGSLRSDMMSLQGTTHTSCETVTIYIIDTSK